MFFRNPAGMPTAARRAVNLALVGGCCLLAAAAPARAQAPAGADTPQLVDRIVAIVDEEAILQSDLQREIELYRMEQEYAGQAVEPDEDKVRDEMLERLVESKLIIAAAKQADLTVDDEAIAASVQTKIDQFVEHFGSLPKLEAELKRSGMSLADYRTRMTSQLRDQQYLRLVVGKFIRSEVEVLENEVREYYLAHLGEMPAEPDSLTIADILVPVQPDPAVRQALQQRVTNIRAALDAGRAFADVAREFSQGPNAQRGGGIGIVAPGDLFDPALERAVFALQPDGISEPVLSSRGLHLMKVDAVQEDGRRAISQIFLPIEITQADVDRAQAEIVLARQRVQAGEPFATVAGEVSADAASARNGGLLGTFRLEDLSAQFQEVLAETRAGELTEPVLTPAGWYVFLVRERTSGHRYTYEELREQLRQVVENQKIETALAAYVAGLRDRFFIDQKD